MGLFLPTLCRSAGSVYAIDLFPQYAQKLCSELGLNVAFPKLKLAAPIDERGEPIWQVVEAIDTEKMGSSPGAGVVAYTGLSTGGSGDTLRFAFKNVTARSAAWVPTLQYNTIHYDAILEIRAEGCRIWTADGDEWLDACGGAMVMSVGHCHPTVVAAIARQAATLNTHTRYLHDAIVGHAERLLRLLPALLSALPVSSPRP